MTDIPLREESVWSIQPTGSGLASRFREAWQQRALVGFFARRAIERLYRRTLLGRLWLFLRPTLMVLPAIVVAFILQTQSPDIPLLLFLISGMVIWLTFSLCVNWTTRSIQANGSLLSKMYLPRLLLPVAFLAPPSVMVGVISLYFLALVFYYWGADGDAYVRLGVNSLLVVGGLAIAVVTALSISLFTSIWAALYRDVRMALRQVIGVWFLITPVAYAPDLWRAELQWVVHYNPMAHAVLMFRAGLFGLPYDPTGLPVTLGVVVIVLLGGLVYFTRKESMAIERM